MWGMKDDKRKPRHLIINDFKDELKAEAVKDYKAAKKGNILDVLSYIRWKNNLTEADLK